MTSLACGSNFCIALGAIVQGNQAATGSTLLSSSAKKSVGERTSEEIEPDSSIRGKSKSPFRTGVIASNGLAVGSGGGSGGGYSNARNGSVRRNQGLDSISSNDESNPRGRNKTPLKQLTPDEIKIRQREASYDSPRRVNDK